MKDQDLTLLRGFETEHICLIRLIGPGSIWKLNGDSPIA